MKYKKDRCRNVSFQNMFYDAEHSVEVTAVSYRIKTSKLLYCGAPLSITLLKMEKFEISYSNKKYTCSISTSVQNSVNIKG